MYRLAKKLTSGEVVRVSGTSVIITILTVFVDEDEVVVHGITEEGYYIRKNHNEITKNI